MTTPLRSVFVTGSTGKQGGAVARFLLSRGHKVRALTRHPDSTEASKLKELGAQIVGGRMEDRACMESALRGVDAVFLVTTSLEADVEIEVRQGVTVADAAKAAGVRHLVFSSAITVDSNSGIPYFKSKAIIESHIASLHVPYTILVPAYFMENLSGPYHMPGLHEGRFAIPISPGRKLQMISVEDIAAFATLIIEDREPFLGRRISLASDELTPPEIAHALSAATGRNITHYRTPIQEIQVLSKQLGMVYEWLDRVGTNINIEGLRRDHPEIAWQRLQGWAEARAWGLRPHERVQGVGKS